MPIMIPGGLKNLTPGTRNYRIRLQGTGDISFMNATDVFVQSQNISIFIQTDKGTYKAGQKIQIRSFALYPNSSIYTGNFTLDIQDPKANIIKHWNNLQNTSYGVISKSLDLDSQPVLGDWVIKVTAQGVTKRATVKVDEYVLPKFKLETSFPQSAQVSDREVSGSVVATYTYGRPVPGRVNISVSIPSLAGSFKTWSGQMFTDSRHVTKEEKFTIPLSHLRDHLSHGDRVSNHVDGTQIKVEVKFTEDNTEKTVSKTSYIRLQSHGVQFSISHKGSNRYIPGFNFPIKIIFTDNEGRAPNKHLPPAHLVVNSHNSSGTNTEQDKHIPIPSNGLIDIDVPTPNKTDVHILEINVTHDNIVKTLTLNAYDSNQTHIKINVLSADHRVGKPVTLNIQANKPITEVYYQFVSRGLQVLSGRHDVNGRINSTFNVQINEEMTPETSILVYNVDSDTGNIYADQASISVNGMLTNSVSVMFGQTQVEPGDRVNLNLQTAPHSMVYLSAVDTSSILMGNDNDIIEQSLINGMKEYKPSIQEQLYFYKMSCGSQSAIQVDHDNTYSAYRFEEAGAMIVTDVQNYVPASYKFHPYYDLSAIWQSWHHSCGECCGMTYPPQPLPTYMSHTYAPGGVVGTPMPAYPSTPFFFTTTYRPFQTTTPSLSAHLSTAKHVRSNFPETWLWTSQFVGDSGNVTISSVAPDSITSWVASAFSMNKDVGIGVSSAASKLNVFRPFFININLPFSVIHGEEVVLQVNIFNYMTENLTVLVTLEHNSDFQNIVVDDLGYTHYESITKTSNIQVCILLL
ncbi:CD109 antigen-like [Saccostrea echinata]|uniref:CD109 antigen-like n=1 Tax=Saccostrea echinata TaxID=191078 RepID=UPI002A81E6D3|nr:CD109 antigen-like [Saccostrea echinata]